MRRASVLLGGAWTLARCAARAHVVPPSKPPQWVELTAYAREHGIPGTTLRRRLKALHERYGNVLHTMSPPGTTVRKWWFDPSVLQGPAPTPTAAAMADELAAQAALIQRLEAELERMRAEFIRMRRRLRKQGL